MKFDNRDLWFADFQFRPQFEAMRRRRPLASGRGCSQRHVRCRFCSNAFLIERRQRPVVSSHAVYLSPSPEAGELYCRAAEGLLWPSAAAGEAGPPSPVVWLTWGDSAKAAADCQGASHRSARLRAAFVRRRRPLSSHNMCCCQGPERAKSAFLERRLPPNPLDALPSPL